MKNILLCCNKMGIGGVETVILNQVVAYSSKGYNVYVMAEKGDYSKKVEELGGFFIEMEFPEENDINEERVKKIIKIIKEKEINEIHIHKYQCIPNMMIAAFISQTPYFAYEHGIIDSKGYYTWNYPIYKTLFPIYYKNAYKIIAITPNVANNIKKEYDIEEDKYVIIHNGIDFNIYKNDNQKNNTEIVNALIVSRIDKEKILTIYNGIEAFKIIKKKYPKAKLNIVGGGNAEKEVIEYLNQNNLKYTYSDEEATVRFYGKQIDVKSFLEKSDIFLGVDRCALEAIAMKIPVIISGYNGIKGLITKKNMNIAMEENFSGLNMETVTTEEYEKQLDELIENRKKIIDEVYAIAKEQLNCYKNYIVMPEKQKINIDWYQILAILKENRKENEKLLNDIKLKYEWIEKIEEENKKKTIENERVYLNNKEIIETKEKMQKNIDLQENEIEKLKDELIKKQKDIEMKEKELNQIYNSKRWKYIDISFLKITRIYCLLST